MTLSPQARRDDRSAHERKLVDDLGFRLRSEFSSLPAAEVTAVVSRRYEAFAHCPVRDFIIVLVERACREELLRRSRVEPRANEARHASACRP